MVEVSIRADDGVEIETLHILQDEFHKFESLTNGCGYRVVIVG